MTRDRKFLLAGALALLVAWTTAAQDEGIKIGIVDLDRRRSTPPRKARRPARR